MKPVGSSGVVYYYHADHLGSSSVITDQSGALYQRLTYLPFGSTRSNSLGSQSGVPYKYTGQMLDDSTGLYFYNARYYDPLLGRFVQADTIVPGPTTPQSLNRYSYVVNNPIRFTDPYGYSWLDRPRKWLHNAADDVRSSIGDNAAIGVTLQVFSGIFPGAGALGTWALTQSEQGRIILAGEIVVATAILSVACDCPAYAPFRVNPIFS